MSSSELLPRALVLVRNTVSHDARVLREAETLRSLDFAVLVAGVVSTSEVDAHLEIDGTQVVRLNPTGALRGWMDGRSARRMDSTGTGATAAQAPHDRQPALAGAGGIDGLQQLSRRLAITTVYYLQGIGLAWRTSPALVHANDYNTMWIGIAAKLLRGSRLIYDSHELWPDRNGRPEWRPWLLLCEALFVRIADTTITTSPGYAAAIAGRYRVAPPLVIRNIPAGNPRGQAGEQAQRAHDQTAPLAVYIGGLIPGRGIEQAIRALARTSDMRLELIGPGSASYRSGLIRCAEEAGVADRVRLAPAVPPNAVLDALADADLGLMLIEPVCRSYELTLPNKLFEYAAAGLPILASDLPVIGPLVRSEQLGEVVPSGDVELIAEAMRRLAEPVLNRQLRERALSFARRVTWAQEQPLLTRAYTAGGRGDAENADTLSERRRVSHVYERYTASSRKHRDWSAENAGNAAIRAELVDTVLGLAGDALFSAREILDLGCGSGWWLGRMADNDRVTATLHGLELLPERVTAARTRVPQAAIALGDARALPYPDRSFDVVTLFTVLSSLSTWEDAESALHEAQRVLRAGGVLLVWEPRLRNPLNRDTLLVEDRRLRHALGSARIEARTTTVLPALARRLGSRTDQLYPLLARIRLLRTHRLVCARVAGLAVADRAAPRVR